MGLAAFLVAHLLFAAAFIKFAQVVNTSWKSGLPLISFAVIYVSFLWPGLANMKLPVVVYVAAIVFMTWQALGLHSVYRQPNSLKMALGAVLFMISDSIIAYSRFIEDFRWSQVFILTLYWLAIYLLARAAQQMVQDTTAEVAR